jgi:Arc/MetJ-type ribon-helix-helix transcriptional regulator
VPTTATGLNLSSNPPTPTATTWGGTVSYRMSSVLNDRMSAPPRCIPSWYRFGMSTQIAVRLPDDLVAFVDDLVSHGDAASRAAVVSAALERERRRKVAERDAVILASAGTDADLDSLAAFAAATSMDDLD